MKSEDRNIILLKSGNSQALTLVYDQYSPHLYAKILSMVKDADIAQELLQDVFLKVWHNRERIDPSQSFQAWIFTIAVNIVYDYYRKLSRDTKIQQEMMQNFTAMYYANDDYIIDERRDLLNKALVKLPPQRLLVFKMCKIEGLSYQEVAEKLNISTSTVSNHLVKATKAIKDHIFNSPEILLLLISYRFGK